jgi:hypothetical protein
MIVSVFARLSACQDVYECEYSIDTDMYTDVRILGYLMIVCVFI